MPTLDEVLDEMNFRNESKERKERTERTNHFYFSAVFHCFRFAWLKGRGHKCNHGLVVKDCEACRFDSGDSEPGVATEERLRAMYAEVLNYGKPDGPILNDVRFSVPIPVEWQEEEESQKKPGKYILRNKKSVAYLVGKSDTVIQGDNQRVVGFTELKTPRSYFVVDKITKLTRSLGTKRVPLTIAGIQEPQNPGGVMSLPQVAQLAIGAHVLRMQGRQPDLAVLQTVSRAKYREHLEVVVTPEEYEYLYTMALWWVREAHINNQFDEMPAPEFFTGYDCNVCPFSGACAEENKRTGQERVMHPIVPGIQARIEALHDVPEKTGVVAGVQKKGRKKGVGTAQVAAGPGGA